MLILTADDPHHIRNTLSLFNSLINTVHNARHSVRKIELVLQIARPWIWNDWRHPGPCKAYGPAHWVDAANWLVALDWRLLAKVCATCPLLNDVNVRLANGPRGFSRPTNDGFKGGELWWRWDIPEGEEMSWLQDTLRGTLDTRIPPRRNIFRIL